MGNSAKADDPIPPRFSHSLHLSTPHFAAFDERDAQCIDYWAESKENCGLSRGFFDCAKPAAGPLASLCSK